MCNAQNDFVINHKRKNISTISQEIEVFSLGFLPNSSLASVKEGRNVRVFHPLSFTYNYDMMT